MIDFDPAETREDHVRMRRIRYIGELSRVREVTLGGIANGAYWRDRLADAGLCPVDVDGHARVMIGVTRAYYGGLRADECVIAVEARPTDEPGHNSGYFLVQGYNTSRLLAWFERHWFTTPYLHGTPCITANPQLEFPIDVRLTIGGIAPYSATLGGNSRDRSPTWSGDERWEGPIYLPASGKVFYARLGGVTHKYPFIPAIDCLSIEPNFTAPVWRLLLESDFTPRAWSVRPSATHARSKTYCWSKPDDSLVSQVDDRP
jgi:hypothetical protein